MMASTSRRALLLVALVGFLVGIVVSLRFDLFSQSEAINLFGGGEKPAESTPTPPPSVALPDFAALAEHVSPAVVNISSTQEVRGGGPGGPGGPGLGPDVPGQGQEGDPFHDFFEPFERF